MSRHEIDIEGLPEGWKPVAFRPRKNLSERYLSNDSKPVVMYDSSELATASVLIVEKIQPRRIVLEETDEETNEGVQHVFCANSIAIAFSNTKYKWLEVKETDLSLTKDEPKLSLSVEECKDLTVLARKISEFIKDKS